MCRLWIYIAVASHLAFQVLTQDGPHSLKSRRSAEDGCEVHIGPKGDRGLPGPDGDIGMDGMPGMKGAGGFPGRKGSAGLPGDRGRAGLSGESGIDGRPGSRGLPGSQGPSGQKGEKGDAGFPGRDGLRGEPGETGMFGYDGQKGMAGVPGEMGTCDRVTKRSRNPIAFYGQAYGLRELGDDFQTVSLTSISLNEGQAFDNSTSRFSPPVVGIYQFSITVQAAGIGAIPLVLFHNEQKVATTARSLSSSIGKFSQSTNLILLKLQVGDHVSLKVRPRRAGLWGTITKQFVSPSDVMLSVHLVAPL